MEDTMEDLAMNGKSIERAKRKKSEMLEKAKKCLKVDDYYNGEPLTASDIGEVIVTQIKGLKSPEAKKVLGKQWKSIVNSMIDVATALKTIVMAEKASILNKV